MGREGRETRGSEEEERERSCSEGMNPITRKPRTYGPLRRAISLSLSFSLGFGLGLGIGIGIGRSRLRFTCGFAAGETERRSDGGRRAVESRGSRGSLHGSRPRSANLALLPSSSVSLAISQLTHASLVGPEPTDFHKFNTVFNCPIPSVRYSCYREFSHSDLLSLYEIYI